MLVACRISSNQAYSGDVASSSDTKEGLLNTTVAGPGGVRVDARFNGELLIDLCPCSFYAYSSSDR